MIPQCSSHSALAVWGLVTTVFRVVLSLFLLLSVSSAAWSQLESAAIRGTVSDSSGAPIKEVVVTARTSDSKFSVTTTTDESGAYAFSNLPLGTYSVLARIPGLQVIHSGLQVSKFETVRFNFSLNPANTVALSGFVADPTGAKIPGVPVTATNADTHEILSMRTEHDGSYKFPNLQAGEYRLSASLRGFRTLTEASMQLGPGATMLNFRLTLDCPPSSCIQLPPDCIQLGDGIIRPCH